MRTIGVGIIGWGFMGRAHTHALRSIPLMYPGIPWQPRLISVCSRRMEDAREAQALLGFTHATDDYRELIDREDVEVVSICTPNEWHEEMAAYALRAGKHVYIDKPLTHDEPSARRLMKIAREQGVSSQVVLNNRFFPAAMRARELVEQGRIGQVLSFHCRYLHSGSVDPQKPIGWKQRAGAGVLQDLGSHALDLVTWLAGRPVEGFCSLRTLYPDRPTASGARETELGDDHAAILLRLENGALGVVEASKIATGAEDELSFELYGDRGALRMEPMRQGIVSFFDNTQPDGALGAHRGFTAIAANARYPAPGGAFLPPKNTIGWDRSHIHCYYSFLDCVVRGVSPSPSIEDGAYLQYLMDRLYRSSEQGRWVSLTYNPDDPDDGESAASL